MVLWLSLVTLDHYPGQFRWLEAASGWFTLSPQAEAALDAWKTAWQEQLWQPMAVPSWSVYQAAFKDAWFDSSQAFISLFHLLYIIGKPLSIFLMIVSKYILWLLYKYVLVEAISKQGGQQVVWAANKMIQFQKSLTWKQIAGEVGAILLVFLLYKLRKWLQGQKYIARMTTQIKKRMQAAKTIYRKTQRSIAQSYRNAVNRIAQVSLWLAIMTPHALFAAVAVTAYLLFPGVVRFLACETALVTVLAWWIPLLITISLLHEASSEGEQEGEEVSTRKTHLNATTTTTITMTRVSDKENQRPMQNRSTPKGDKDERRRSSREDSYSSPVSKSFFPRTTPSKVGSVSKSSIKKRPRSSLLSPFGSAATEEEGGVSIAERQTYWLYYWMVHAAVQAMGRILFVAPVVGSILSRSPGLRRALSQLELGFYLWIYLLPVMLPTTNNQQGKLRPAGRPLDLLAPRVGTAAVLTYGNTNIFTEAWWQGTAVRLSSTLLDVAVFTGLISRRFADSTLLLIRQDGPSLFLPSCFLLVPVVATYGLLFAQYCQPLARSWRVATEASSKTSKQVSLPPDRSQSWALSAQLQYWVLHALVTAVVNYLNVIFRWIPFFSVVIFGFYVYLSLQSTIQEWYGTLQDDLVAVGVLPCRSEHDAERRHQLTLDQTWTGRTLRWILERVPRAADLTEDPVQDPPQPPPPNAQQGMPSSHPVPSEMQVQRVEEPERETRSGHVMEEESSHQNIPEQLVTSKKTVNAVDGKEDQAESGPSVEDLVNMPTEEKATAAGARKKAPTARSAMISGTDLEEMQQLRRSTRRSKQSGVISGK